MGWGWHSHSAGSSLKEEAGHDRHPQLNGVFIAQGMWYSSGAVVTLPTMHCITCQFCSFKMYWSWPIQEQCNTFHSKLSEKIKFTSCYKLRDQEESQKHCSQASTAPPMREQSGEMCRPLLSGIIIDLFSPDNKSCKAILRNTPFYLSQAVRTTVLSLLLLLLVKRQWKCFASRKSLCQIFLWFLFSLLAPQVFFRTPHVKANTFIWQCQKDRGKVRRANVISCLRVQICAYFFSVGCCGLTLVSMKGRESPWNLAISGHVCFVSHALSSYILQGHLVLA